MLNLNYALRRASVAQIEAFRSDLDEVAAALAADGWVMSPRDPDASVYDVIHVEFIHSDGAALFAFLDLRHPRNSGFTVAPRGWADHGRVHLKAGHGFIPTNPEAALRAIAITEALGDRVGVIHFSSTPDHNTLRYGTGTRTITVDID